MTTEPMRKDGAGTGRGAGGAEAAERSRPGRNTPAWTPARLFVRRLSRYWRDQIAVWRTALDWTVWLYLIVPALWIGGGTYLDWYAAPPSGLAALPAWAAAVPAALLLFIGRLRVFAEDADVLYLLQRGGWLRTLTALGAAYTAAGKAATTALLLTALLPLLLSVHGWTPAEALLWGLAVWALRTAYAAAESWIAAHLQGWRRLAAMLPTAAAAVAAIVLATQHAGAPAWTAATAAAALTAGAAALRARLAARGVFERDTQRERKARLASTELLLMGGGVMERKPVVRLRRPLVFRRSGRLFRRSDPGTMLAEMRIKAFLRKWTSVRLWFSFFSVSTAAILLCPPKLALLMLALLPIPAAVWLNGHWKEWFDGDFVRQFRWDDKDAARGATLSRFWLLAPGILWLSLLAGWSNGGPAGLLLTAAAAQGAWYVLNEMLGSMLAIRNKEGRRR